MPCIDAAFRIIGKELPADHSYQLYSAISRIMPWLHEKKEIGIHSVTGLLTKQRILQLNTNSKITLRIDSEKIKDVLPLAGKTLGIGEHKITAGVPEIRPLIPSPRLYSRLVIIKGFMEPEKFLKAVQKQLDAMEIKGKPHLVSQVEKIKGNKEGKGTHSPYLRRTIRIHDKEVVGFAVGITELTAEESIKVQETGIGGRRKFGCGIFVPERR